MLASTVSLPRLPICEAINAICNVARERMADESRHVATLYGIQDANSRFSSACCSRTGLLDLLEGSVPAVSDGDGSGAILRDAIVAIYALVEVSQ